MWWLGALLCGPPLVLGHPGDIDLDLCKDLVALHAQKPSPSNSNALGVNNFLWRLINSFIEHTLMVTEVRELIVKMSYQLSQGIDTLATFQQHMNILQASSSEIIDQEQVDPDLHLIAAETRRAAITLHKNFETFFSQLENLSQLVEISSSPLFQRLRTESDALVTLGDSLSTTDWTSEPQKRQIRIHLRRASITLSEFFQFKLRVDHNLMESFHALIKRILEKTSVLQGIDPALAKWWDLYLLCLLNYLLDINLISERDLPPVAPHTMDQAPLMGEVASVTLLAPVFSLRGTPGF